MESVNAEDVSNLGLLAVGLLVQLLLLWRVAYLAVANRRDIGRKLHKLVDRLCGEKESVMSLRSDEMLPSSRLVAEKVCKRRMKVGKMYLNGLAGASVLVLASIQLNIVRDRPRWMSAALSWVCVGLLVLASLPLLAPRSFTPGTLDVFYVALMVLAAFSVSPLCCPLDQLQLLVLLIMVLIRMPVICLPTRTFLIVASNFAVSGLVVARVVLEEYENSGCLHRSAYPILWTDTVCSAVIIGVGVGLEAVFKQTVQQDLRYSKATEELSAATSLLQLTCDAVVELDEELRLTEHSKELAAILLRDRPGASLAGVSFTDFVASTSEASRVIQFLNAKYLPQVGGRKEGISAHAFHTRLVDSCSSKFRTEIFQVKYRKQDGQLRHLLGLRDFTDQKALAGPHAVDGGPQAVDRAPSEDRGRLQEDSFEMEQSVISTKSHGSRVTFLLLDPDRRVVEATSVRAAPLVGMSLSETFPDSSMANLLSEINQKWLAQDIGSLAKQLHSFQRLNVQWSPNVSESIDGTMEVLLSGGHGAPRLLLRCYASPALPAARVRGSAGNTVSAGRENVAPSRNVSERSRQSSRGSSDSRDCFGPVVPGRLSSSLMS